MGDAPRHGELTKPFEQSVCAAPHVQDDGQLVALRNLQLRFKKMGLLGKRLGCVDLRYKTIQTNFAYRDQSWVITMRMQMRVQGGKVFVFGLWGVERMYAQSVGVCMAVG